MESNLLCPLGSSECHSIRASVKSWPPSHLLHAYNFPPKGGTSQDLLRSHAKEVESVHVWVQVLRPSKPLLFHFWETDPLLLCYPPQPPDSANSSFSIRKCLKHPATTETSLKNMPHDESLVQGASFFHSYQLKAALRFPGLITDMLAGGRRSEDS